LGTSSSRFLPSVATLIKNLDRAGVKTPGSRSVEILAGASFDDHDVDLRQRQLGRNIIAVGLPPAITTTTRTLVRGRYIAGRDLDTFPRPRHVSAAGTDVIFGLRLLAAHAGTVA
jgi:hypothetical protein